MEGLPQPGRGSRGGRGESFPRGERSEGRRRQGWGWAAGPSGFVASGLSLEEVHTGVQEEGEEGTCRAPGDMGDPEPGPGVDRADLTSPLKSLRCLPGPWLKL